MAVTLISYVLATFLIQTAVSQYAYPQAYYQVSSQQGYYQQPSIINYAEPDYSRSKSKHHTRRRYSSSTRDSSSGEDSDSSEDSSECRCACDKCQKPKIKSCCRTICESNCNFVTPPRQDNIVLVPYPYPLILTGMQSVSKTTGKVEPTTETASKATGTNSEPEKTTLSIVTEKSTKIPVIPETQTEAIATEKLTQNPTETTTESITSESTLSTKPNDATESPDREDIIRDIVFKRKGKDNRGSQYIMTSMRRMQSIWEPKYGIVPIPDDLALKLMQQLRNINFLKGRRHTTRVISNSLKTLPNYRDTIT